VFLKFDTFEEKTNYGRSFIEIQFCKLKKGTSLRKIVSVNSIKHHELDSLYIHTSDIDNFIDNYGDFFNGGVYNNLKTGFIDISGINYYKSELIESFINLIKSKALPEYEKIILWLEEALQHNGFYILGI
jgi:hypothetical protein